MIDFRKGIPERNKIFLNEYYFGQGTFWSVTRIFTGPLLLLTASIWLGNDEGKGLFTYAVLLIGFGMYYVLKPLLTLLTNKNWRQKFEAKYGVENDRIIITQTSIKSEVPFREIKSVRLKKTYSVIRLSNGGVLYITHRSIGERGMSILEELSANSEG